MAPKVIKKGSYKEIIAQGRTAVLPDVYYKELPQELRRVAFTVSGIARVSTVDEILKSLDEAEKNKVDFSDWVEQFNIPEFSALMESRRETVYRTNMTTQYNNGRIQVGLESETLTYLKYQATLDDRTRPNHAANDGVTLPIDDPFWDTNLPPLGYNCRCIVLNLDAKDLAENPLTPKSDLTKAMTPDKGFDGDVKEPESQVTKIFKDKARELPTPLRAAATEYLLEKNKDLTEWWKNAKKDFVKPE